MSTQTKTFDCVEMKRHMQARLAQEYDGRKTEFASYVDFLKAKSRESEWVRRTRARFRRASTT